MTNLKKITLKNLCLASCACALLFWHCTEIPEYCSDHNPLNPNTQFCHGGRAYEKCGGEEYNPTTHACESGALVARTSGYNVTIESEGSGALGAKDYNAGDMVFITSGTPPAGMQFKVWTTESAGVSFADPGNSITAFTMPSNSVTVRANFEPLSAFPVTVESEGAGASGSGDYIMGAMVVISSGAAPANHTFKNWTTASPGVVFADSGKAATIFNMPGNAVIVTAVFELDRTYPVTVENGGDGASGGGDYYEEATVFITAGTPPENHTFKNWTTESPGVVFTDAGNPNTDFTMPANEVKVKANFERLSSHSVTYYGNGSDGGEAPEDNTLYFRDAEVTVMSEGTLTKAEHIFSGWNTETDGSGDSYAPGNTFNITADMKLYARWTSNAVQTFDVTVKSAGSGTAGSGSYAQGAAVTIRAGTAPAGQRFKNWTTESSGVNFDNANAANTGFIMPGNAVDVTAIFEPIPTFEVKVESAGTGAAGGGSYAQGATVTIRAGTAPAGQRFKNWTTTSQGVNFADANSANTRFTMPANTVTVTANFEAVPTFEVKVVSEGTNPSDSKRYAQGATVTIIAGAAPSGQQFKNWTTTSPGVKFDNDRNAVTEFIMPGNDVTVTAVFEPIPKFEVKVESAGTGAAGGGTYAQGATVTISAGTLSANQKFINWTTESQGVVFDNADNPVTGFIMPGNIVTVKANVVEAGTFNDNRDGVNKTYKWTKIGGQTWMAENLNYAAGGIGWCYNNSADSCAKYGRLYTWSEVMGISTSFNSSLWSGSDVKHQGICPSGWHIPSDAEWTQLENAVGKYMIAGRKLKSQTDWDGCGPSGSGSSNVCEDAYGFSALPGGSRSRDGSFSNAGYHGDWWSVMEGTEGISVRIRSMGYNSEYVTSYWHYKESGFSLRCVRD